MPESRFVVDQLYPTQEFSLISGPSSVGKSIFMLQSAADWAAGRPVLGFASHPTPFAYIACDHSLEVLRERMRSLGISPHSFPHTSLLLRSKGEEDHTLETAINAARDVCMQAETVWLDGLPALAGRTQLNIAGQATTFLMKVLRACKQNHLTMIGTVYGTKAREGQEYASPLHRIAGSVVMGSLAWSKTVIEFTRPGKPCDPHRTIFLYRPNAPLRLYQYEFDAEGHLLYRSDGEVLGDLDSWLTQQAPSTRIQTAMVVEFAASQGISRATTYRWLADQLALGTLLAVRRGEYQTLPTPEGIQ